MKKDQNLPNKNIHSNNSSGKPLPNNSNYSRNQSPYDSSYRGRSPEQRNSRNFSQNRYNRSNSHNISIETTIHDQIQTEGNICLISVPIQILGIDTIQAIDHENHHTIETETIQTIVIEVIQIIEINVTKTIDQEIIHATDLIINEQITTTTIKDHEIIHKIGIQTITINKEIILNLIIEIIIATPISNTNIEAHTETSETT